jgi:hypothetical protein
VTELGNCSIGCCDLRSSQMALSKEPLLTVSGMIREVGRICSNRTPDRSLVYRYSAISAVSVQSPALPGRPDHPTACPAHFPNCTTHTVQSGFCNHRLHRHRGSFSWGRRGQGRVPCQRPDRPSASSAHPFRPYQELSKWNLDMWVHIIYIAMTSMD